ncbi:MAG: DUF2232 domain-containing protein [Desulfococcaceae bacterium]
MNPPAKNDPRRDMLRGVALVLFAFSASVFLPVVGFFFALFIPLPVLFFRVKRGRKTAAVICGGSGLLMALFLGGAGLGNTLFFGGLLLLGFLLGDGLGNAEPVDRTVLTACGWVLGGGTVLTLFYVGLSGLNLLDFISEGIRRNLELSLALYREMGVPAEQIDALRGVLDLLHQTLLRLLPAMIASAALFAAWASLVMGLSLLRLRGVPVADPGPLNRWRPPDHLIWGVIACGVLLLIPHTGLRVAALNGLFVLLTVYFFAGIAVVSFFFEKRRLPRPLRALFYALVAIQQPLLLVVVALGLFDMWFNFRKLDVHPGEK